MNIKNNLTYEKIISSTGDIVHVIVLKQGDPDLTLLISKISEAVNPNEKSNQIGEGATIDEFLKKQNGVRFIINGGFNHYRKNFYEWKNQDFNVGDPVGVVKIRNHYFEDYIDIEHYGFFTQKNKKSPWYITNKLETDNKYILGCTPLLIYNGVKKNIPDEIMLPMQNGKVNPPSILAHGKQLHSRTAVGLKDGNVYFILMESCATILQLQEFGFKFNIDSLLNLDGGGSSQFKLYHDGTYLKNNIQKEDIDRVLGHVIVLFDQSLK